MTDRENVLSLFRRTGYERVPYDFNLCASQIEQYKKNTGSDLPYEDYFDFPLRRFSDLPEAAPEPGVYMKYYDSPLAPGAVVTAFGVAREPGGEGSYHFFRQRHPMAGFDSAEQVLEYPFPSLPFNIIDILKEQADAAHKRGKASVGRMSCTIWETAWALRGMENLMVDIMTENPLAEALLDRLTAFSCERAANFARAGADILHLGDDVGTQRSLLMSKEMYCARLKPRIKKVIDTAKSIRPDILVYYHSCGYVTPLIKHFADAGIDILDPVQPESMDFAEIHAEFGDRLSFNGSVGTQTTLPFGAPDDIKEYVWKNLDIAGEKGGLLPCPTHTVEPEVPWENIVAYVEACGSYK
ncbi:MAG: hypothetical protein FWF08_03570 [Oscillospiraceae bacterium]|nr:hypothetical protein [Oscillospiraceae bacterium]